MKKLIFLVTLASSSLLAEYSQKVKIPSVTFKMAIDENFGVMQRNCQWCHSYGYILNQGKQSREYWEHVTNRMRDVYNAPILKNDEKSINDYLFRHYGNGEIK